MTTPRDLLDPEFATLADSFPFVHLTADNLQAVRDAFALPADDATPRDDRVVDGDLTVRVHGPAGTPGPLPCLVSAHAGGYCVGTRAMSDPFFDLMCPIVGMVGVSVEYRRAPENPYPAALEDYYRALCWAHANAAALGVDPARIGIGGASAGGGLTAALALLARDRGGPAIAFQLIDSPMLDDRRVTPSSRWDGLPIWTRESNEFAWRCYLGPLYGTDDVPCTAAPARAADLSGLPPAFVAVGGVDGFRDETVDYALRLAQAGVPVELHLYPGACHGFSLAPDARVTLQHHRNTAEWLARQARQGV